MLWKNHTPTADEAYRRFLKTGNVEGVDSPCKISRRGFKPYSLVVVIVVFLELPMTARDMHQAIGRVYRQGQQSRVIVTIFIARRTIQHTLLKRILETEDLNNQVLNSPDSLRKDLFPDG